MPADNPGQVERLADLAEPGLALLLAQPGVRLPGSRRLEARAKASREGIALPEALYGELETLAGRA